MSFLYRPTPVVNWGSGPFASNRVMSGWHGATMRGIPAGATRLGGPSPTGAISRMRRVDTRMQPWLKTSGTMGSFIPNGLGQDDGSGIDWSTAGDVTPTLPDLPPVDLTPPDLGSPSFSPNLPVLVSPGQPASLIPTSVPIDTTMSPVSTTLTPPAGAGPTGTGIPGTQSLASLQPSVPPSALQSIGNAISSLFAPSSAKAPAGYTQLPGYAGTVAAASASVLPGVSNSALLFGVGLIAILAIVGGKK